MTPSIRIDPISSTSSHRAFAFAIIALSLSSALGRNRLGSEDANETMLWSRPQGVSVNIRIWHLEVGVLAASSQRVWSSSHHPARSPHVLRGRTSHVYPFRWTSSRKHKLFLWCSFLCVLRHKPLSRVLLSLRISYSLTVDFSTGITKQPCDVGKEFLLESDSCEH